MKTNPTKTTKKTTKTHAKQKPHPPRRTQKTISAVLKDRGFHIVTTDPQNASAIVRGEKTGMAVTSSHFFQKGDFFVCEVYNPSGKRIHHEIDNLIFEVTHISQVKHDAMSVVCFVLKPGFCLHKASSKGKQDTITMP